MLENCWEIDRGKIRNRVGLCADLPSFRIENARRFVAAVFKLPAR